MTDLKTNPKAFWKYSNSRLKTKPKVGDLKDTNGKLVSDAKLKAGVLNEFFASVFTTEDVNEVPELDDRVQSVGLTDITISTRAVEEKLRGLKVLSSPGPDDLHPRVLKEAHRSLSVPFAYLFRKSLDTGCVPEDWKLARVVPIYKKGSKVDPCNYRPVSLTAIPCKVLESLIRDELLKFLTDNELMTTHQHGFRPGRSCNTQLLVEVLDD